MLERNILDRAAARGVLGRMFRIGGPFDEEGNGIDLTGGELTFDPERFPLEECSGGGATGAGLGAIRFYAGGLQAGSSGVDVFGANGEVDQARLSKSLR